MMQFRFAAIESVEPEKRPSATAVVLLGGLISAFLGTEVATLGKNYFETDFVGSFVLLAFLFVIAFILMTFFQPAVKFKEQVDESKRSLVEIVKQGSFIVAVCAATTGYVVMSFIMTATPVSMHVMDGHSLHHTKVVLQSHVIAMFLPSLFTALIVRYIGLTRMMLLGILLFFISVIIAFMSHALTNYWWSLVLLGLGWNFLFIGGTNLLPRSYNENEKFKVQSINDFLIFGLQALAALSAGWFVFNFSWEVVLLSVIPLLLMQLVLLLWWLKKNG
jgi:predicted MFS family arabinose efflux permease